MDNTEKNQRLVRMAKRLATRWDNVPYDGLGSAEQVFRSIWELEAEVNNGGFPQYFENSSGRIAPYAEAALRAIAATRAADIVGGPGKRYLISV